ncbi:hypothetical protein [Deinococcus frigens]|uniref:hypothetical protein n=1 Tax=Deinococcus frigens TaxID=249403 RepID=UPI0012EC8C5C|nr:hypothetical protein [Deinococcus frigens]
MKRIPGVSDVREFTPPFSAGATHWLRIRVGSSTTEVLGSLGAGNGAGRVNSVLLWIDTPQATTLQKQAVTAVARGVLARCMIGVSAAQLKGVSAIAARSWVVPTGFQEKPLGQLKIGWGQREALQVGPRNVSGLSLNWPRTLSRCDL